MEVPLSWERLLWSRRGLLLPWDRYVLTDFRLVRIGQHGLGQTQEPGARDLDELDQRLLVPGDEPRAERTLGFQRERLPGRHSFLRRAGPLSGLGL